MLRIIEDEKEKPLRRYTYGIISNFLLHRRLDRGAYRLRGGSDPEDPREATETAEQDWEEAPAIYGDLEVGKVDEANRVLEEADYQANAEEGS